MIQLTIEKLLLKIKTEKGDTKDVKRFDDIIDIVEKVRQMIGDTTHRFHALSTSENLEHFVNAKVGRLSMNQKNILTMHINLLLNRLKEFKVEDEALLGSRKVKESLERSLLIILR